tara:strand:+ start:252 stop:662 length:411 start_codon:yes stop_codon:yes gene_type:complete
MKLYFSKDIEISFDQLLKLKEDNKISLTIDNVLAIDILTKRALRPGNTYLYTFVVFSFCAIGALIYSIYLSFTNSWWWFIPGFFISFSIWEGNRKSVAKNLIEEALRDENFYDRIKKIQGWAYRMEENDAKKYLIR